VTQSEQVYVLYDPFEGDKDPGIVELSTVHMVTTRKPQKCMDPMSGKLHDIPVGTRARYQQALIDKSFWGRYYVCVACMDKWLEQFAWVED
jgi:hypothetical protein